jgi:LuxR family maltose regulon positive regulatory protein
MPRVVLARRRTVEAYLQVMTGDLNRAERVLDTAPEPPTSGVVSAGVRVAVERGDVSRARRLLEAWPDDPEPRAAAERLLWSAVLDHLEGDLQAAKTTFDAVVDAAEVEGDIGLFRAAGPHALGPARALYRDEPTPFLRTVVEAPAPTGRAAVRSVKELVEQLTEREFALMALLPTRLSNVELAERLGISVNTVKTHLKHIYRKLGVTGRTQAVTEAERLRLL